MNELNLLLCDDNESIKNLIGAYVKYINGELEGRIKINPVLSNFTDVFDKLNDISILVLDMYDGNRKTGMDILDYILNTGLNIPTIIYTIGSKDENTTNYSSISEQYPFVKKIVIKGDQGIQLRKEIKKLALKNINLSPFKLYDEDDVDLCFQIQSLGKENVEDIIEQIKLERKITDNIVIHRMNSGFSGAVVFKIAYEDKNQILKLSKDKISLRKEITNAIELYEYFPSYLRINIRHKEFENEELLGILLEEVDGGCTFFDWLMDKKTTEPQIIKYMEELFLNNNSLKDHYKKRRVLEKKKFDFIFDKFDYRIIRVKKAVNELSPLLNNFPEENFCFADIESAILGSYRYINKSNLLGEHYQKQLILCHGDFHGKNIMIQGTRPILIDTGGLCYNYWCSDISRLIVHLFIVGFDINTINYFNIDRIKQYLKIGDQIINMEILPTDDKNNGYIHAINWLIMHAKDIYDDLFDKWEFQLGICKELLQISYRVDSIPPTKRATALLIAHRCILAANSGLESLVVHK